MIHLIRGFCVTVITWAALSLIPPIPWFVKVVVALAVGAVAAIRSREKTRMAEERERAHALKQAPEEAERGDEP